MTTTTDTAEPIRLAFICVQNAGRSQIASVFAERERDRRELTDRVDILTGGTHPADHVHEKVIEVMDEAEFDLSDRTPREISIDELRSCDYVATMGCSTLDVGGVGSDVAERSSASGDIDVRDWALDDPAGQELDRVREIRDTIEGRVGALFDEIEAESS